MTAGDPRFLGWLVGSMRSGLVAIDSSGMVTALNRAAVRMLGCAPDALGKPCAEALQEQPLLLRVLESALDGCERPSRAELTLEPVGEAAPRTIGFTLETVRDPSGAVRGAALFFRDLAPFERRDEQERLRDRLAALGEMAAGLAHELRNPLAGMEVLAGLLRRQLAERPEDLALLSELQTELRVLARTVTESLEFVRPVRLRRSDVDAVELLEESLALARSRVPFAGTIERRYEEDVPAAPLDAEQLRAVVTNLVVNAFESMAAQERPEGHRLCLGLAMRTAPASIWSPGGRAARTASAPRELVITVSDSGAGVPAELRERVFHPFFTTKPRGSGVGLAHAQKVVAAHGGMLLLEDATEEGATFRICLPLERVPA